MGGPAPYWQSFGYDLTGNRTSLVQHDTTGDTTRDLRTTQTFPAAGTTNSGSGGPHGVQSAQTSAPGFTYTNPAGSYGYDKAGNTTSISYPAGNFTLPGNAMLTNGQSVRSDNALLAMQSDGNLVLTSLRTGTPTWSSGTYNHPGAFVKMQADGNLVIYKAGTDPINGLTAANALWSTNTSGNNGAYLALQDDGNLVIYKSPGRTNPAWSSNTWNSADAGGTATLNWDAENKLASVTQAGQTTSYLYDADGSQLIRRDPGKTTVNLGGQELTLNTSNNSASNVRTIPCAGGMTLTRVTAAIGGGTSFVLASDPHGTNSVQISNDTSQNETRRYTDPFGNTRGRPTPVTNWAGDKGFVGGTADPTTELVNLGAREYQPSTGRFLNPDPLLDDNDPQQWNGYAYGNNSPLNQSDPTGLRSSCGQMDDDPCGPPSHRPADIITHQDPLACATLACYTETTDEVKSLLTKQANVNNEAEHCATATCANEVLSQTADTWTDGSSVYTDVSRVKKEADADVAAKRTKELQDDAAAKKAKASCDWLCGIGHGVGNFIAEHSTAIGVVSLALALTATVLTFGAGSVLLAGLAAEGTFLGMSAATASAVSTAMTWSAIGLDAITTVNTCNRGGWGSGSCEGGMIGMALDGIGVGAVKPVSKLVEPAFSATTRKVIINGARKAVTIGPKVIADEIGKRVTGLVVTGGSLANFCTGFNACMSSTGGQ
jgi:RHS repeat-associated protein